MNRVILVTGDRAWKDIDIIRKTLRREVGSKTTLIHGDSGQVDRMAGLIGEERGWTVIPVPANWSIGRKAGPIRNRKMLDMKPDKVYAFHGSIRSSKGTKDCMFEAKRRGIPGELIGLQGEILESW